MKQKYIYSILFALPGIFVSAFFAIFIGAGVMSIFYFFVYGDREWPTWPNIVIYLFSIIAFLVMIYVIALIGYKHGKSRDNKKLSFEKTHIFYSLLIFIFGIFFMIFFNRGYIFTPPPSNQCRNICIERGYDGNSIGTGPIINNETMCSCFNTDTKQWDEIIKLKK